MEIIPVPGHGHQRRYSESKVRNFCDDIRDTKPNSVLITGDISIAPMVELHLGWMEKYLPDLPIYFVLGNHDYYDGSFLNLRGSIKKLDGTNGRLVWLNTQGVVALTEKTALVGHDGWYDGGYGNWHASRLIMNDYHVIQEMRLKPQDVIYAKMQELAQECADHINTHVREAAKTFPKVLFATHVPAFRNNSRAPDGRPSDPSWLPNMSSKKAGDALVQAAMNHRDVQFTCLSGHTHTKWEESYLPNLKEITGDAEYGVPSKSIRIIEVD
jgi:predicted phosphohydrolase